MRTKTTLVAVLALPLLLMACDRADQSPTAATSSQEKQAMTIDKEFERSPPAAGPSTPSPQPQTGTAEGQSTNPPIDDKSPPASQPQDASKKGY